MAYQFRLQDPGEGIHEAEIIEVSVSKGDSVKEGDDVLVAETDKAAVDIPVPVSGEIVKVNVSEGDVVSVGDVLMEIEEADGGQGGDAQAEKKQGADRTKEGKAEKKDDDREAEAEDAGEGSKAETARQAKSKSDDDGDQDKVRQKEGDAEQENERAGAEKEEPADAEKEERAGSGKEKRTDGDKEKRTNADKDERADTAKKEGGEGKVLATPAVRGLARDLGVDLDSVTGSGEDGRILEKDVRGVADEGEAGPDEIDKECDVERVKLRSLRRSTAKRMAEAWREIPNVTHADAVDITEIEKLRREQAQAVAERGGKLTLTPFLLKAIVGALREHPRFNARFDAEKEEIEVFRNVNVGVALDTERGLLVPVLRNVERKSVFDLAIELVNISLRLRRERPDPQTLRGGTFTLTNVGSIGGSGLSPIINPPQVAIFGAARAELRQVVTGNLEDPAVETRLMLPVCVTFDHRVNDGADAARFMNSIKQLLESPQDFALRS